MTGIGGWVWWDRQMKAERERRSTEVELQRAA